MKTYAVTGGASGIGAAVCQALKAQKHSVISVDLKGADINADLSTESGCADAIKQLESSAASGLDGFVPCAGVGPSAPGELLVALNYVAVAKMTEGLLPLLAKKRGTVVLISSNSAPMPAKNAELCELLIKGDYEQALERGKTEKDGHINYTGTKKALALWMRRNCAEWFKQGVRVNAIAPGMTMTPLVQAQFDDPAFTKRMETFRDSTPMGAAQPEDIAKIILFLLGDDSHYCCGSILFADGGIDALMRPDAL
jgi:NAD(P)-dependent dehydrogenase (short-subunit alcohol dehydrogenase family)